MHGIVEKLFIAHEGGAKMEEQHTVEAVAGRGLRGDRYMEKRGFWSGTDECQLTLIEGEVLEVLDKVSG